MLLLALASGRAAAQLPSFVLEAPCISRAELEARLQPMLPEPLRAADVLKGVAVRVRPAELEHEVEIVLPASAGQPAVTRTLRGESCETVIDATVIVVGLWVQESKPAAPATPPPTPPSPAPKKGAPVRVGVELGGAISNAMLPGVALGLELSGVLRWGVLRVALGVRSRPSQKGGRGDRVAVDLLEGELLVAVLPIVLGPLELGPAVGLAQGRFHAEGVEVENSAPSSLLWVRSELALQVRLAWPRSPVAAVTNLGGSLAWSRPAIEIGGEGIAFRPARVSPYATLGIELMFE